MNENGYNKWITQTPAKLVKQTRFDFILLDIGMPDIGGYEVAKIIRHYEDENALTAHDTLDDHKFVPDLFDEVFVKPITPQFVSQLKIEYLSME